MKHRAEASIKNWIGEVKPHVVEHTQYERALRGVAFAVLGLANKLPYAATDIVKKLNMPSSAPAVSYSEELQLHPDYEKLFEGLDNHDKKAISAWRFLTMKILKQNSIEGAYGHPTFRESFTKVSDEKIGESFKEVFTDPQLFYDRNGKLTGDPAYKVALKLPPKILQLNDPSLNLIDPEAKNPIIIRTTWKEFKSADFANKVGLVQQTLTKSPMIMLLIEDVKEGIGLTYTISTHVPIDGVVLGALTQDFNEKITDTKKDPTIDVDTIQSVLEMSDALETAGDTKSSSFFIHGEEYIQLKKDYETFKDGYEKRGIDLPFPIYMWMMTLSTLHVDGSKISAANLRAESDLEHQLGHFAVGNIEEGWKRLNAFDIGWLKRHKLLHSTEDKKKRGFFNRSKEKTKIHHRVCFQRDSRDAINMAVAPIINLFPRSAWAETWKKSEKARLDVALTANIHISSIPVDMRFPNGHKDSKEEPLLKKVGGLPSTALSMLEDIGIVMVDIPDVGIVLRMKSRLKPKNDKAE